MPDDNEGLDPETPFRYGGFPPRTSRRRRVAWKAFDILMSQGPAFDDHRRARVLLKARSDRFAEDWPDAGRRAVAWFVADVCRVNERWPNGNFRPNDAFDMMIGWRVGDLSEIDILDEIDETFDTDIANQPMLERVLSMTFAEVVDLLAATGRVPPPT